MAVTNRAAKLAKLHRVAKKHYQPVAPPSDRSVLDHLLYACVLEDTKYEAADEAFARLQEGYFDWNEVRVTTAVELAEVLSCVTDPNEAAVRLKKTLHSMFETDYTFDIDILRKENLGKAVQKLEEYSGITPFVVSYVAQNGLSGHSIGIDKSLINLMYTVGVIDEKEAHNKTVPGLERAIAKNKGVEFFSLVHQLAVAYSSSPFNNEIRNVLLGIDTDAKDRFPKRVRKKKVVPVVEEKPAEEPVAEEPAGKKKSAAKKATPAKKADAGKKSAASKKSAAPKKAAVTKKATKTKAAATKKKAAKKTATKKPTKKPAVKKKTTKKAAVKKTAAKKTATKSAKKTAAKKKTTAKKATRKNSASKRLAKKKPR